MADGQLTAGQHDTLAIQGRIEPNTVAVMRVRECLTERAWAAVVGVGDDDSGLANVLHFGARQDCAKRD